MSNVRDVMIKNVVTVSADSSVFDVVITMRDREIGAVIVTENEQPKGIFSERDLITKVLPAVDRADLKLIQIRDFMSADLIVAHPDQPWTELFKLVSENNIRHLPVVEGGRVVGILSMRDLLKSYHEIHKSKTFGDLLAAMNHHINQPLMAAYSITNLVLMRMKPEEENYLKLEKIKKELDCIEGILKKIESLGHNMQDAKTTDYLGNTRMLDLGLDHKKGD